MKRISFVIIVVVILAGVYAIAQQDYFPEDDFVEIDDIVLNGTTLAISSGCKALVAETSEERAAAIQAGIDGVIVGRPTIYDAFVEVIDTYNMTLVSMAITGRDEQYYYSDLVLQSPTKILRIDIKPSDAMALALRTGATMYINRTLIEAEGLDWC